MVSMSAPVYCSTGVSCSHPNDLPLLLLPCLYSFDRRHMFFVNKQKIAFVTLDARSVLQNRGVCFITAGPITKVFAWGGEGTGGHVLLGPVRNQVL